MRPRRHGDAGGAEMGEERGSASPGLTACAGGACRDIPGDLCLLPTTIPQYSDALECHTTRSVQALADPLNCISFFADLCVPASPCLRVFMPPGLKPEYTALVPLAKH